jgi:hypothetical protein
MCRSRWSARKGAEAAQAGGIIRREFRYEALSGTRALVLAPMQLARRTNSQTVDREREDSPFRRLRLRTVEDASLSPSNFALNLLKRLRSHCPRALNLAANETARALLYLLTGFTGNPAFHFSRGKSGSDAGADREANGSE